MTGQGSLLHIMDQTRTAAGSRLLRNWLCHPLADMALIRDRHDAVEEILTNQCGKCVLLINSQHSALCLLKFRNVSLVLPLRN